MPNRLSAKKRLRQNEKLRIKNRSNKSEMRTQLRKVRQAVAAGEIETAEKEYRVVVRKLDRAGTKHLMHKNTVARTKSRLQKLIKSAKQSS